MKTKNTNLPLILLTSAFLLVGCGSEKTAAGAGNTVSLSDSLTSPGQVVDVPASGEKAAVNGVVIDQDQNGIGESLDLSGNGRGDMVYLSGSLNGRQKAGLRMAASGEENLAFDANGDGQTDYFFLLKDGQLVMSKTTDPEKAGVTLQVTGGEIQGFDETGNGTVDNPALKGIVPIDKSGTGCFLKVEFNSGAETTIVEKLCLEYVGISVSEAATKCEQQEATTGEEFVLTLTTVGACPVSGLLGSCEKTTTQGLELTEFYYPQVEQLTSEQLSQNCADAGGTWQAGTQ